MSFNTSTSNGRWRIMQPLPSSSADRSRLLRELTVPSDSLALWFLGQNGFILKTPAGTVLAIDPYLTNSCVELTDVFDLQRIIPVPIEPEDLDVDCIVFTHSHGDHLDLETLRRMRTIPKLVAPWEAGEQLRKAGYSLDRLEFFHPRQVIRVEDVLLEGTFALPTDATDLNHMGVVVTLTSGLRFYNTGDTAYCASLAQLLPYGVELCAICINGGFNNLSHGEAAKIVNAIAPDVVIPTHYDLMACNQSDPEMFRVALRHANGNHEGGHEAQYERMDRDHIYLYTMKQES